MTTDNFSGDLSLGHVFGAAGLDVNGLMVLRHTYTQGGLESPADLTPEKVLDYTRRQGLNNKLGKDPAPLWLCFMADGQRRSRVLTAYENHGEVPGVQADGLRHFDLRPSEALTSLKDRLVVEWSGDTVNWAKKGVSAALFPVIELADPHAVPFPGFDRVLISYSELRAVVEDSRYASWRTALGSVQGIYLIADSSTGQLYVGKADGAERILGRWSQYARDAHGGNVTLKEVAVDPSHRQHFMFSILRVFGPSVPTAEVDETEAHYKRSLLTRQYGYNRN